MLPSIDATVLQIIGYALAVSGFLVVLEAIGMLPDPISRWINRNRAQQTIDVLKKLGFDDDGLRRRLVAGGIPFKAEAATIEARMREQLASAELKGTFEVGSTNAVRGGEFIDIMGASTDRRVAESLARELAAFWRNLIESGEAKEPKIDLVAGNKLGSPLLAAAVAQRLGLPLILYTGEHQEKYRSPDMPFQSVFDCRSRPSAGQRALLVDDSSTGGGKAADTIDALRRFGIEVSDFVVLFEPLSKVPMGQNAALRLKPLQVALHSILKLEL